MANLRSVCVIAVVLLLGEAQALRASARLERTHAAVTATPWNISLQDAVVVGTTAGRILLTSVANVSGGFATTVQAVDAASGATSWTWEAANSLGAPPLLRTFSQAPNVVCFVSKNGQNSDLYLLHASNGSIIWSVPNATLSDAVDLFMAADGSAVYVVEDPNFYTATVSAFDIRSGNPMFQQVALGFNYLPLLCGAKGAQYPCVASLTMLPSSGGGYETNLTFLHGRTGAVAGLKMVVPTDSQTALAGRDDLVVLMTGGSARRISTETFATMWDSQAWSFAEGLSNGALLPYIDPKTKDERLAVVIPTWREMCAMDVTTGEVLWLISAWTACPLLTPYNQSAESFGFVGLAEFPSQRRGTFAATLHCDYGFGQIQVAAVYSTANATASIWQRQAPSPSTGVQFYALGTGRFATVVEHSTATESLLTIYDARSLKPQQEIKWTSSANAQNPVRLFHAADRDIVQELTNSTGLSFLATVG